MEGCKEGAGQRLRFADRLQTYFRLCIETSEPIDHADER